MKTAHEEYAQRLNVLRGQLFASDRMGVWCFNRSWKLYYTTAVRSQEMAQLLEIGGVKDYALSQIEKEPAPSIYADEAGLVWIPEWAHLPQGGELLVVLGPMALVRTGEERLLQRLDALELTVEEKRTYADLLDEIPVIAFVSVMRFAQMLHYTIYDDAEMTSALRFESRSVILTPDQPDAAEGSLTEPFTPVGRNDYQRMLSVEDVLLRSLAEGVNGMAGAEKEQKKGKGYGGELLDYGLDDPIRTIQDNMIIFTGLCSRTAVRAGVPAPAAKETEAKYVRRLEASSDPAELAKIHEEMYLTYVRLVQELHVEKGYSKAIRSCRDYIRRNCTSPLKLEDIARHVGYSEYYLTRKFTKETGQKLNDYIRDVRIDFAKGLLLTTSKDIQTISEELQFGSRGYFDRCFMKAAGMSPARYRETGGRG